jgi:hypothetical protein
MDKRKNNGGNSTKAVREDDKRLLTKSEIQDTYENLKPHLPEAILQLEKAIKAGEKWSIELFFKYFFSLPKTTTDLTSGGERIQTNIIHLGHGIKPEDETTD